jgi:hypothetical protein
LNIEQEEYILTYMIQKVFQLISPTCIVNE